MSAEPRPTPDDLPPADRALVAQALAHGHVTLDELRLVAKRERDRQAKQTQRERTRQEQHADASPTTTLAPMPAGLSKIRRWVRDRHDAYDRGEITSGRLAEARRSAGAVGDLYRVGADLRRAEAAIRQAEAQERMADALLAVEHGGAALLMLSRLQDGLASGQRRPLPARVRTLPTTPQEPA